GTPTADQALTRAGRPRSAPPWCICGGAPASYLATGEAQGRAPPQAAGRGCGMSVVAELPGGTGRARRINAGRVSGQRAGWWLRRKAVAGLMNLLIAVTAAVAVLTGGQAGPGEGTWGSWVLRL